MRMQRHHSSLPPRANFSFFCLEEVKSCIYSSGLATNISIQKAIAQMHGCQFLD
jgi:hypothetical protein